MHGPRFNLHFERRAVAENQLSFMPRSLRSNASPAWALKEIQVRLRIALPYVGDRYGGSNESSLVMAEALKARGHDPIILSHGTGRVVAEATRRGLEVLELPRLSRHGGYDRASRARPEQLLAFGTCFRTARNQRFDIIHTNDLTMLRTWALPTRAAGATLIAHWRAASRVSLSVSYGFALANRVVSVSEYSKNFLPVWVQHKTVVEYNSLDTFLSSDERAGARTRIRAQLGVSPDSILIGVFGNLSRRKRAHVLADIIHRLPAAPEDPPIYGLVCGAPAEPLDNELFDKIERFDLGTRILRPGFVRPVYEWMGACDMTLAPAEKEPLARNVLEAQAAGVPVIVSSDGGLTELIRDKQNGIILPPDDVERWITAVRNLIDDPRLAEELGRIGQESARKLRPELHAARIEEIYIQARAGR